MIFELTGPHFVPGDMYLEPGEIVGHGKIPPEWAERRRDEKKPVKIAAPFTGMSPTPQMEPLDDEARDLLEEWKSTHPDFGADAVEMLPLTLR